MNLLNACAAFAAASVLFAAIPQRAFAAADLQIVRVNPEGGAKTRTMRVQIGDRSVTGVVDAVPVLTNADVKDVSAVTERIKVTSGTTPETRDVAALRVKFTPQGAKKLAALAKEWKGKQIALIVDGRVLAAPKLTSAGGGELTFSGNFTPDESRAIAAGFKGGAPAPAATPPKEKPKT